MFPPINLNTITTKGLRKTEAFCCYSDAFRGDSPRDFFRDPDLEAVRLAEAFAVGDEGQAVGREVTTGP